MTETVLFSAVLAIIFAAFAVMQRAAGRKVKEDSKREDVAVSGDTEEPIRAVPRFSTLKYSFYYIIAKSLIDLSLGFSANNIVSVVFGIFGCVIATFYLRNLKNTYALLAGVFLGMRFAINTYLISLEGQISEIFSDLTHQPTWLLQLTISFVLPLGFSLALLREYWVKKF